MSIAVPMTIIPSRASVFSITSGLEICLIYLPIVASNCGTYSAAVWAMSCCRFSSRKLSYSSRNDAYFLALAHETPAAFAAPSTVAPLRKAFFNASICLSEIGGRAI